MLNAYMPRAALATTLTALALIGGCGLAVAGQACTEKTVTATRSTDSHAVRVSYRDLNLATDQGSRALYQRISAAARRVCAAGDNRNLAAVAAAEACAQASIEQAVHEVNNVHFESVYAALPRG